MHSHLLVTYVWSFHPLDCELLKWGTLAPQVPDGAWHAVSALRRVHSSELTILNPFVMCKIEICPLIRPCIYSAFAGQPARFSAGNLVAHLR